MTAAMPQPPLAMVAPAHLAGIFLYANCAVLVMVVIAVALFARRGERMTGYALIGAGAAAVLNEAIVDRLGLCWFPAVDAPPALYHAFGVSVPRFMLPVYAWYVGGQAVLAYALFRRGVTRGDVLRLYGLAALLNFGLEAPGLNLGIYAYYGDQPLRLLMFPCWWAVANALMPLALAAFAWRTRAALRGWRRLGLVIAGPPLALAVNAATVSPVWLALNANMGVWPCDVAALVAVGLGLAVSSMMAAGVVGRGAAPMRPRSALGAGEIIV
jgi:hypothetical protein